MLDVIVAKSTRRRLMWLKDDAMRSGSPFTDQSRLACEARAAHIEDR